MNIVEVFYGQERIASEPNMVMDNLGEVIAEFMSLPRALKNFSEASALLDASNYSIRAASLGKDAAGYQFHAHSADLSAAIASDGILRVVSYGDVSLSSYQTSSFYVATNKKILPEYSDPTMNRLEEASTQVAYLPSSLDMGHNLNLIPSGGVSASLGCYAPTGTFTIYLVSASVNPGDPLTTNYITSASYINTSGFNAYETIDSKGFILMDVTSITEGRAREDADTYGGLIMSHNDNWNTTGDLAVKYILYIYPSDFICLNLFGGIYNIGLWCYDIKAMLDKGLTPPFNQYDKELLEYKLVARKTFTKDLTYYRDSTESDPGVEMVEPLKLVWSWKFK